jgi:antitoxin YefM
MAIPDTVSYSEFRANLATYLDAIENDSLPLVVKRKDGKRFVITTAEHYNSMDETTYLLSNPANKKHLLETLGQPLENFVTYNSVDDLCKDLDIKP